MEFRWRSTKQPSTAMPSAAAEIVALSDCVKDVNLRMWIAEEAGIPIKWPVEIQVDNKAAVSFQNKMNPQTKMKGIFDMRKGWLKELHDKKRFKVVKVHTEKNLADPLTKPVPPPVSKRLDMELDRIKALVVSNFRGQIRVPT